MNNALRITLMVFVLLLIVLAAGTLYIRQNQKKILEYSQNIKELDEKIAKIDETLAHNIEQRKELDKIKQQVEFFDKTILEFDSPPVTYDYLLDITSQLKGELVFDFTYSGQKEKDGLITNSYLLRGSGDLNRVYQFISHIEKQKPIYYIYDLALSAPEITVSDTINYSFMIDSVSESPVPKKIDINLRNVNMLSDISKLFTCGLLEQKIAAQKADNKRNQDLFDIEGSRLIAVTSREAYFRDKNGIFQVLNLGDMVKNGSLSSIDSEFGSVTFTIKNDNGDKEVIFNVGSGGNQ